jgi:hypothetical protein
MLGLTVYNQATPDITDAPLTASGDSGHGKQTYYDGGTLNLHISATCDYSLQVVAGS